jgi:hypothetical protein
VGSEVKLAPELGPTIVHGTVDGAGPFAETVFLEHGMLVLDDVPWETDLDVLRAALVRKKRAFKAPYLEKEPAPTVRKEINRLLDHAKRLFLQLYPTFKSIEERTSWRPMITGPEPLHFDTYGGKNPMVTAYINVSAVPRVYGIGPNFPTLLKEQPSVMRWMMEEAVKRGDVDMSYVLRKHPKSPLLTAPRHRVELAPGAIWFFNAKTVSHEVIYGEGAVGISWEVPGCGAKMQTELLDALS